MPKSPSPSLDLLTPHERAIYEASLQQELARLSPLDFSEYLRPDETRRYRHTEFLNRYVTAFVEFRLYPSGIGPDPDWYYLEQGRQQPALSYEHIPDEVEDWWAEHPETGEHVVFRLAIAMPPRHGKSFIVTENLPLWYWTRYPKDDIAFVTYSDDFASDWGVLLRDRICDHEEKLAFSLPDGRRTHSQKLRNSEGGNMILVGTGGALTGKGFQLGIIDDPFKDDTEAYSAAERRRKAAWYSTVFVKRKTRKSGRRPPLEIMMFTRWHEEDLAGQFAYTEEGDPAPGWYILHLPALAEEGDPLGRAPGEALCSAMKTKRELEEEREMDPVGFAALNQGRPATDAGGIFHTWQHYEELPKHGYDFVTVDLAATKNDWSDYCVAAVWRWDRPEQKLYLLQVYRERLESPEHQKWITEIAEAHKVTTVAIENKTFGQTLVQELSRKQGKLSFNVVPLKADRDKVVRAMPYGGAVIRGQVLLPKAAPWLDAWINEHNVFPNGRHDDQVDVGAYAWEVVNDLPAIPKRQREEPSAVEKGWRQIERRGRRPARMVY